MLVFLTTIILVFTSIVVVEWTPAKVKSESAKSTSRVLQAAQQALIGYALQQEVLGTLPCPDIDGDGISDASISGCSSQLAFLPYKTLGAVEQRDSSGALLWYAVELDYVANSVGSKNSSALTTLTLDGELMAAVVLAPSNALEGQDRVSFNVTSYLEGINGNLAFNQFQSLMSSEQNDQILGISANFYWSVVEKQILNETRKLLDTYRTTCGEFPWAAPFGGPYSSTATLPNGSLPLSFALPWNWGTACGGNIAPIPPNWLVDHWDDQLYYRMCTVAEGDCLTVSGEVTTLAPLVLVAPGLALAGQLRPNSSVLDYFESENAVIDTNFQKRPIRLKSSTFNDTTN